MILAVDIGNTQTCIGAFENESTDVDCLWRESTTKNITVDEVASDLIDLVKAKGYSLDDVDKIAISCVVPSLNIVYEKTVKALISSKKLNTKLCMLNPNTAEALDEPLYKCKYAHPHEVGSDIIATCIAAKKMYDLPCAIIDFGTATNINVINSKGEFVGAVIAAGMKTSLDSLIKDASALSDIQLKAPDNVIGSSTPSLIQSGVVLGEASRADGLIERIEEELGEKVKVICTGGWSKLISKEMKHDSILAPNLVLQGLKIFAEHYNG